MADAWPTTYRSSPCWSWPTLFAGLSFVASSLLAPQRPTEAKDAPYECGIVPDRRAGRALPGALLPGGDDLHHLRHRDHLPLPVGRDLPRPGHLRAGGDGDVRRRRLRLVRVPHRPTAPSTGARSSPPAGRADAAAPERTASRRPSAAVAASRTRRAPRGRPRPWAPDRWASKSSTTTSSPASSRTSSSGPGATACGRPPSAWPAAPSR